MNPVIRAIDVGFGHVKYVVAPSAAGSDGRIVCAQFPSQTYFGMAEKSADGFGDRRKTVVVQLDSLKFEVGPEILLAADRHRSSIQHDSFYKTPQYRAFMAGALHYMKVQSVDLLVLGLPVAQFKALGVKGRNALTKSFAGSYDVGGRKVLVRNVLLVAQPQGALFDFAAQHGEQALGDGRNLIVDVGSRTFDWLVTRGMKVETETSGSIPRGVTSILEDIARSIGQDIGEQFTHLDTIDEALRTGRPLRVYRHEYQVKSFDRLIGMVAKDAVAGMRMALDTTFNIERVLLVGGGAVFYRKALEELFPKHEILTLEDPQTANVRGFQRIGEAQVARYPERYLPRQDAPAEGANTAPGPAAGSAAPDGDEA